MYQGWWVGSSFGETWIVHNFNAHIPEGAVLLSSEEASWRIDEWFRDGSHNRTLLVDICATLLVSPELATARLKTEVRSAFRYGTLVAYRLARVDAVGFSARPAEQPKAEGAQPVVDDPTDWIAIELMDDSDPPKPVPFKKYRIELPDASVREGMLDENGQAWFRGIDPGSCQVSFPQFHGDDWKPG
jgi:hypothetical protein